MMIMPRSLIDKSQLLESVGRIQAQAGSLDPDFINRTLELATADIEAHCNRTFVPIPGSTTLYDAPFGSVLLIKEIIPTEDPVEPTVSVWDDDGALVAGVDYVFRLNTNGSAYDRIVRLASGKAVSWRIDHETDLPYQMVSVSGMLGYSIPPPALAVQETLIRAVRLWLARSHFYADSVAGPDDFSVISPPLDEDQILRLKKLVRSPVAQIGWI